MSGEPSYEIPMASVVPFERRRAARELELEVVKTPRRDPDSVCGAVLTPEGIGHPCILYAAHVAAGEPHRAFLHKTGPADTATFQWPVTAAER